MFILFRNVDLRMCARRSRDDLQQLYGLFQRIVSKKIFEYNYVVKYFEWPKSEMYYINYTALPWGLGKSKGEIGRIIE